MCFVLKKGVLPTEALKAAREGLSLIGCGEVCQIAQYTAIESVLGKKKFNLLFSENSQTSMVIASHSLVNPLNLLRSFVKKENPESCEIKKGMSVYLQNAQSYLSRHPLGNAPGYNALCIGDTGEPRFTTLGLSPKGITHQEAEEVLIKDCNSDNFPGFDQFK